MPRVFDGAEVLVYVDMAQAVKAARDIGAGAAGVRYTAKTPGTGGNSVRVAHVTPAGAAVPLSVSVVGNDVTVNLGTAAAGVANSTAAAVRDAVNAHGAASALLTASLIGDGTGTAVASAIAALTGGAAKGAPNYQAVAEQQDLEIDDSRDEIEANSKSNRFSRTLPGRRSISFELPMLLCFDATQDRLYRAYEDDEEVLVRYIVPARVADTDRIREARARITSFPPSFPDSDVATISASFTLQEAWRDVA